ncbi:MAG TPA: amidohydrolase family protein [Verrucomicrobiota bacterium]|nr:amidohydrolase family protein [Verrucomicrobiota bacterium]
MGSAYAEYQDHVEGTLTPGKLADVVILDRDIFTIPPTEIDQVRVVCTIMDGRVVFDAEHDSAR